MGADKLSCNTCGTGMEYDEGEGNLADGYDCFECLEEEKTSPKDLLNKQEAKK